ncbi:MAG: flagellar hook-basal body complex protein FliE [Buchnera aphidicola (Meitanaphis microgallis)]
MFTDTIQNNLEILTSFGPKIDITDAKNNIFEKFTDNVKEVFSLLNSDQEKTESESKNLTLNKNESMTLNDILINLQKNLISTETLIQIRNKLMSGYQELMNVQI